MTRSILFRAMVACVAMLAVGCGGSGGDGGTTGRAACTAWVQAADAPFNYYRFDAEYSPSTGKVYLLGGRTSTGATDGSIWEFDPATGAYTDTGVDMPYPVSNYQIARLTYLGTEVLVTFGGRLASGTPTNTVQGYYPSTGSTMVFVPDPYPVATTPGGVAVVNNIAYAFGGFDGAAVSANTYIFDPNAAPGSRWTTGPALSRARTYIGAAVIDQVVYAIGGDEYPSGSLVALATTEKLDTRVALAWNDLGVADLPGACDETQVFGFDSNASHGLAGSLVMAGCGQWDQEYATALRYNVATDTWDESFPDLNQARRNHAGAIIPAGTGSGRPGLWVWGGRQGSDSYLLAVPEYCEF